jgi:hypothetical protein
MTAAMHTPSTPALDLTQPLRLAPDQREQWQSFAGDGLTFDEAIEHIFAAAKADGERHDIGIAALSSYAFGPAPDGTAALATIPAPGRERRLVPLRHHAFGQLCQRVGAPSAYVAKLPAKLQMACLNHGIQRGQEDGGNLLRMAGGEARALLSDRYAALDNELLVDTLRTTLREAGMLADVRVRALATGPTTSLRLTLPGDAIEMRSRKVGDVVEHGLDLLNGEIGNRAVNISAMTYRLVCLNGLRTGESSGAARLRHIGDPARLAEAFRDAVPSVLAESQGLRKQMAAAVDRMVDDILGEFEGLSAFGLSRTESRDVARDVMAERAVALPEKTDDWGDILRAQHDVSAYDIVNGITHVAQNRGTDRRLEMEEAAGRYLRRATR